MLNIKDKEKSWKQQAELTCHIQGNYKNNRLTSHQKQWMSGYSGITYSKYWKKKKSFNLESKSANFPKLTTLKMKVEIKHFHIKKNLLTYSTYKGSVEVFQAENK